MNIEKNPIGAISKVISKENGFENPLDILMKAIIVHLGLSGDEIENIINIISDLKDRGQQEFLGATLLRFYRNHENIIEDDKNLRLKIISLFDSLYEHTIYKRKKITVNTENHKKLPILLQYVDDIENSINKIKIEDLSQFNSFRNKYLRLINTRRKADSDIIKHFLNKETLDEIENIFRLVDSYIKASDIHIYNKLKKKFQKHIKILEEINSEYNNLFLLEPLKAIYTLIEKDLNTNNPDAKTSKLIISSTEKKYPLSVLDTSIELIIKLTNVDEGKAYDTKIEILNTHSLTIEKDEDFIGTINAKKTVYVKFDSTISEVNEELNIEVKVSWKDYTQEEFSIEKNLIFKAQRVDINWEKFEDAECYSREAIDEEEELIGRKDILEELYRGLDKNKNIKSYYIHGQKRVGKTSIAKVLQSRLKKNKEKFLVLYIEGGDYVHGGDFKKTINNLGKKICKQIKRTSQQLSDLEIPVFKGSLQPLVDFLDDVKCIDNDKRIIFILDEFDEVSSTLYKRNEVGNAFFLTMRSISNKANYSFILVGGEKINFIISIQGEQLNKFKSHRVDYFDKEHWNEFKDLVKIPVANYLDITDEAISKLYESTAGNPFFTNVICEKMMEIAIEKRDSFITHIEIEESIDKSISNAEPQIFSHFWEDGIKEDNDKEEEISYKRRRILLALSELEKNKKLLSENNILDKLVDEMSEKEIKRVLKEFVERTILIENNKNYSFRIGFFKKWLLERGSKEIIMTLSDEQKIKLRNKEEKNAEISATEIKSFINRKKIIYNGNPLTTDDVRSWLDQFETNINQRLIFKILENLIYYNPANIKVKMKEIFRYIKAKQYQGKRVSNVLVSYLDRIGKSGVEYSKYFIEENSILARNSIEKNKILEKLNNPENKFKYLVFVDDFLGTGNSIIESVKKLKKDYPEIFKKDIEILIGIVTGFQSAKELVEQELDKINIKNIKIIICQPLDKKDKCFSNESRMFANSDEKRNAKDLCLDKGYLLSKNAPLGYGGCESIVIFPETCPNNCLPILWAENKNFKPLFKRKIN